MIRVVLDTNVVVAASLTPYGLSAQVLLMCLTAPDVRLCLSDDVYAEYGEVLRRPKFKRDVDEMNALLQGLRDSSLWFKPTMRLDVCFDHDDNAFLECAQAADAHYLVTGNIRHFPARWVETNIVTDRQFLDVLG